MNRPFVCLFFLLWLGLAPRAGAQDPAYTREDTLRGSITPERAWWDLAFYDLQLMVEPATKSLRGSNTIRFRALAAGQVLQVDLQPPMQVDKVVQGDRELTVKKVGVAAHLVTLAGPLAAGQQGEVVVHYSGKPRVARRPPWDGGFQWLKDEAGHDFISVSCQGQGASLWWPCKDIPYDEPDSLRLRVTVPQALTDVSNGRLRGVTQNPNQTRTFEWFVANPINNYGVNVNIGNYAHFADTLHGEGGVLTLDFYALPHNLEKAKAQFQQAKPMLRAFEHWFGPYPFYADGYKLVEVPYLGMEHQSSVTYGNNFGNGYLGRDLSGTGWGLKWDFIIIHESGHEWFANNITYRDVADMWIHEGFTNYSETLYTEYHFGKKAGSEYLIGLRRAIANDRPIIGDYGVNQRGSGDMYFKGANLIHTIRQLFASDEAFRQALRGLNHQFYHQTVTTQQVEAFLSQHAGRDLARVFDQYLRDTRIPTLEYTLAGRQLRYRWANCVPGLDLPVRVRPQGGSEYRLLYPTDQWQTTELAAPELELDPNFYVTSKRVE
jgi:aminopeptidase N